MDALKKLLKNKKALLIAAAVILAIVIFFVMGGSISDLIALFTGGETTGTEIRTEEPTEAPTDAPTDAPIREDGVYTSKEDVALYLHTYGKLPKNFVTKTQANEKGWEGGSLQNYFPGCAIGGDYFGNAEKRLPTDTKYHECDIDTLIPDGKGGLKCASARGAKRIVYSENGHIYYTDDHYVTFTQLY